MTSLLDLINLRGEEILKDELNEIDYYNFKLHNQILKTLPKFEQIKIMLKYDQILLKSFIKNFYGSPVKKSSTWKVKIVFNYVIDLYPEFCDYFRAFL